MRDASKGLKEIAKAGRKKLKTYKTPQFRSVCNAEWPLDQHESTETPLIMGTCIFNPSFSSFVHETRLDTGMLDGNSLWNLIHVGLSSGALDNLFEESIE